jgi:hypothetical protein
VYVDSAFLGGFILTAKTGKPPDSIWWSTVPSIGAGIVAVLCQALIGYRAAVDYRMPALLRCGLGLLWICGFTAFSISLPIYLIAASQSIGIPAAIEGLVNSGWTGLATFATYLAVVGALQFAIPGALVAVGYERKVQQDVVKAAVGLTEIQSAVVRVLAESGVPLMKSQIREELARAGLKDEKGAVNNAITWLERNGKVTRYGSGRSATFELKTKETA